MADPSSTLATDARHTPGRHDLLDRLAADFAPAERTVPALLARQSARHAATTLVRTGDTAWTFQTACDVAAGTAATLRQAGLQPGDRVAILCGNGPALLRMVLGCGWAGMIAVPINTASRGAQLDHILRNSGARLAVVDAPLLPSLTAIADIAARLDRIWVVGTPDADIPGGLSVGALPPPGAPEAAHPCRPGDTLAILYTSGTTGPSKGVCCPHAQYFWWGAHTASLLELGQGEVLLTVLPLFHTNALNTLFQALLTGSTLVVEPRFSVSDFVHSLVRHKATVTYLLGAMVPMLLSRDPSEAERQHAVRVALAPGVPVEYQAAFTQRFAMGIVDGYGSTETNHALGEFMPDRRPGLLGRPRPGFSAAVFDAEDNALPDGEPGELVLRAKEPFSFATGYFAMREATIEAWRNLWFHTGDRVVREPDGYYRFLDRMKDAIRRRGENISSFEVEQVIVRHPAVANAAVFPVKSELAEEEVMAAIVLKPGMHISPVDLLTWCTPNMPYFAVPRYVDFVDGLPVTENGKVQKFRLREQGITPTSWDREAAGFKVRR